MSVLEKRTDATPLTFPWQRLWTLNSIKLKSTCIAVSTAPKLHIWYLKYFVTSGPKFAKMLKKQEVLFRGGLAVNFSSNDMDLFCFSFFILVGKINCWE